MRSTSPGLELGSPGSPFVIAEAGVNHNGDLALAHRLVDAAAESGADAVKFQTFSPAALVSDAAATAPYQETTGSRTQADLLKALTLPETAWQQLRDHASDLGLTFLSTPFDLESARLLAGLGLPLLKVPSGELTNLTLLGELAALGLPLLVSTGMSTWEEVDLAVAAVTDAPALGLMHCVTAYPAPLDQCNLRAIPKMAARYGVPVGWSDHTVGPESAVAAVALGATVLEKHLTTDRSLPGPDHAASADPEQFRAYVALVRATATSLGDGEKQRMPCEAANAPLVRRSWHARVALAAGTRLTRADLAALRPEDGVPANIALDGRVLAVAVEAGSPVRYEHLAPEAPEGDA